MHVHVFISMLFHVEINSYKMCFLVIGETITNDNNSKQSVDGLTGNTNKKHQDSNEDDGDVNSAVIAIATIGIRLHVRHRGKDTNKGIKPY